MRFSLKLVSVVFSLGLCVTGLGVIGGVQAAPLQEAGNKEAEKTLPLEELRRFSEVFVKAGQCGF